MSLELEKNRTVVLLVGITAAVGAACYITYRINTKKSKKKLENPTTTYVEALHEFDGKGLSLYLCGGISKCPDWQSEMKSHLSKRCPNLVLLNPRRVSSDLKDSSQTENQIVWEYEHLRKADAIMFWFCAESVCPITLYQLGAWSQISKETGTKIFVGCHPEYTRLGDVTIQTELALDTTIEVATSLKELVSQITDWYLKSHEQKIKSQ